MTFCPAFEPLLLDCSSGTIEAADAARLDAHLRTCSACRAEAAELDEVRTLVTLPPPSEAERGALIGLADALQLGQCQPSRRSPRSVRGSAALAVAAAALLAALAYPLLAHRPSRAGGLASAPALSEAWHAPDPEELWEASDLSFNEVDADELAMTAAVDDVSTER
jgi:anti-sigma factor RsiW